jgi:hypothetical protein
MNCEQARASFVDYWRDDLDDAAPEFHEHLGKCEQCRTEAMELRGVWMRLGELPEADPDIAMRLRFYDSLTSWKQREAERSRPFWWLRLPSVQIGLAAAMLVIGVGIGHWLPSGNGGTEVARLRSEMDNMRQLVTLSLLQQGSASDRLRGVNWSARVEQDDTEVLSALLATVNHDPSINVRLAAVDALRKFSSSPVGRRGVIQALAKQTSPMVEIALLDQFVELREKDAVPAIRQFLEGTDVNPEVRQRAEWTLKQLQ